MLFLNAGFHTISFFGSRTGPGTNAQMTGTYAVGGATPGTSVTASMIKSDCTALDCSSTLTIYVVGSGGVAQQKDLFSPSTGPCGSVSVVAGSSGVIQVVVDPASTNGENNGVYLIAP